jgi:hypothetical protein
MRACRLIGLAGPVVAFMVAGCSAEVSPSPTNTPHPNVRVAVAPTGWVSSNADWTMPSCAAGCDPNCVDDGRYQVSSGVVYDRAQDVFWEQDAGPQLVFADAADYCANLSLGGVRSGWRLPSYEELASVLYKPGGLRAGSAGSCIPAIDQAAFPPTATDYYWMNGDASPRTPAINFFDGRQERLFSDTPAMVRCVHDPV